MVKNVKRYLRDSARDPGADLPPDFVPVTRARRAVDGLRWGPFKIGRRWDAGRLARERRRRYMLPADYSLFVEEFRRCPNAAWIMKPANAAQGRGIFIINKLSQIKRWSTGRWAHMPLKEAYVISRYIEDPHLVGGKKYDLRMYVLVTSYRPLRVYMHRRAARIVLRPRRGNQFGLSTPARARRYDQGFARFCGTKYSSQIADLNNPFIHLTNVAIQKHGEDYNTKHGGKWNLQHVRLFVEATAGREAANKLFDDMDNIIIHSLKAVQGSIINDRHCFECYGYDILIDSQLKPWLVEVNASPSLSTTTHSDRVMKMALIRDVLDVVVPKDLAAFRGAFQLGPCEDSGGFTVLYDEALEASLRAEANSNNAAPRRPGRGAPKAAGSSRFS